MFLRWKALARKKFCQSYKRKLKSFPPAKLRVYDIFVNFEFLLNLTINKSDSFSFVQRLLLQKCRTPKKQYALGNYARDNKVYIGLEVILDCSTCCNDCCKDEKEDHKGRPVFKSVEPNGHPLPGSFNGSLEFDIKPKLSFNTPPTYDIKVRQDRCECSCVAGTIP